MRPSSAPASPRPTQRGQIQGLAVDLCRAVAIAVVGPRASVRITLPEADNEFAPLAHAAADLAFLSPEAIAAHRLATALVPGPVVFIDPIALMVPLGAPAQRPQDLAGHTICLMIATPAQRALESTLAPVAAASRAWPSAKTSKCSTPTTSAAATPSLRT